MGHAVTSLHAAIAISCRRVCRDLTNIGQAAKERDEQSEQLVHGGDDTERETGLKLPRRFLWHGVHGSHLASRPWVSAPMADLLAGLTMCLS